MRYSDPDPDPYLRRYPPAGTEWRPSPLSRLYPFVLVALAVILGFLVWRVFFSGGGSPWDPEADPRPVTPRGALADFETTTIDIFRAASPSVVHITNLKVERGRFGRNLMEIPQGTGSGFIWDEQGYVVTNFHVVDGGGAWKVSLADRSEFNGIFVGGDPDKDIAVLKIPDAPSEKLRPIPLGTSADLQVGQSVFAIGNPFSLDQTLTTGVISGLDREIRADNGRPIRGVIQTDAAINPGNSGGPLLDSAGRLIGVNTAIVSPSGAYAGVGFAVPVDTVNRIVPQLIRRGRRERPGLGITLLADSVSRHIAEEHSLPRGAIIDKVFPRGAAARAGLKPTLVERGNASLGDLIVRIGAMKIATNDDLIAALGEYDVGDEVEVEVVREEGTRTFLVKLQAIN